MSAKAETRVQVVREPIPPAPPSPKLTRGRIETVDATALAKPLPAVPFLVEHLKIAAGPPTCFAGFGYSRKTLALQDMALAVATGRRVWGVHQARRGRALHLDYEQGDRLTRERYQRLAVGREVSLPDVGDALHCASYPDVYLDNEGGADAYERAVDGFDLVILDSFRAACPSADENKSDIRKHLDKLARVSERTGALFVIILHSRKPAQHDDASNGGASEKRYSIRGSGALYDALSSAFVLVGEKEKPTRVFHEKCRNTGLTVDDFGLDTVDVSVDGNPKAGLKVVHLDREQLAATENEDPNEKLESNEERIRAVLRARRGTYRGTRESLRQVVKMKKPYFIEAVCSMIEKGELTQDHLRFDLVSSAGPRRTSGPVTPPGRSRTVPGRKRSGPGRSPE